MDNKVGDHVPSDKEVQKLVGELTTLEKHILAFTVALTTDDRKHTAKARPGSRAIAVLVAKLAKQHGLTLPGIALDGLLADVELAERIAPLRDAALALAQRLDDTVLEAESEYWSATTAYYTALARASSADAKLEAELRPAVDFFATGRRRKATPPAAQGK